MMLEAGRNQLKTAKTETPGETEQRRNTGEIYLRGGTCEAHPSGQCNKLSSRVTQPRLTRFPSLYAECISPLYVTTMTLT